MRNRKPGASRRIALALVAVLFTAGSIQPAVAAAAPASLGAWQVFDARQAVDVAAQQAVDTGVSAASADGFDQHVALVDRVSGELVASRGGGVQVISESIVKLFTVAYYLVRYDGHLPAAMADDLHEMIVHSNDSIESRYWTTAAVPAMAARYALGSTANGPKTGPHDWGWEYITADDEAMFLYQASIDPIVGPFLMDAMANVAPVGADGFDQHFGFNALTGNHGSKQGWTDRNTSQAINIHSVGWTARYFGAILETSSTPQYDTMRADSTATARLIAALDQQPIADQALTTAEKIALAGVASGMTALVRRLLALVGI